MATISNTPRPGYVFDVTDNVWYPIGTGSHNHSEIPSTIVDAKGDIITASAADTPARLAVGNNGETLVADSSTSTGLRYTALFGANKNKIINGDFGIWQRGTSFTATGYTADRWYLSRNNTTTLSQQTFTPGTAPVSGYEGTYFLRCARTAGSSDDYLIQRVEDMRAFAGQTVTLSFWAKADTATTISQVYFACNPGSGGSGAPGGVGNFSGVAITTSWARYTVTATMASIAGTTIGTSSFVEVVFKFDAAMGNRTIDIWGVQWEAGSTATPFQTATGTIQGELAACQRYYYRTTGADSGSSSASPFATGLAYNSTTAAVQLFLPVKMRVAPATLDYSLTLVTDFVTNTNVTVLALNQGNANNVIVIATVASGLTQFRPCHLLAQSTSGYVGLSAEL